MIAVSARDLWWYREETCHCAAGEIRSACARVDQCTGAWFDDLSFFSGEFAGDRLLTDGHLAIRLTYVTEWQNVPTSIRQLHSAAEISLEEWLTADPLVAVVPDRLFAAHLLDPLEKAGFRVRPLDRVSNVHGVCVPDRGWHVAGLLNPLPRSAEPSESARAVTA